MIKDKFSSNEEGLSIKPTSSFSPVMGSQTVYTGVLGGFSILALFYAYVFYDTNVLSQRGVVLEPSYIFAYLSGISAVSKDYYDIIMIVFIGFQFMVIWELFTNKNKRLLLLLFMIMMVFCAVQMGVNPQWFHLSSGILFFFGCHWSGIELVFVSSILLLLFLWVYFCIESGVMQTLDLELYDWYMLKSVLLKSFYSWISALLVFFIVLMITSYHPFYANEYYINWRITCSYLFFVFMFIGFPYIFLTNLFMPKSSNRSDPSFILFLINTNIIKTVWKRDASGLLRVLRNRAIKVAALDILVKIFFVPLMITFLFLNASEIFKTFPQFLSSLTAGSVWDSRLSFFNSMSSSLYIMDTALALIGYLCSSFWLKNKSRSVDCTLLGWVLALMCYPPFNDVTSGYLPYMKDFGAPLTVLQGDIVDTVLRTLSLILFSIYVWATMSFGLRFSNLTNRGIITVGPYSWVRHPAYISKNMAWWFMSIQNFASLWQLIFLFGWNVVYYFRAITEEKHLLKDPDYQAYCSQVPYRFIPKVW